MIATNMKNQKQQPVEIKSTAADTAPVSCWPTGAALRRSGGQAAHDGTVGS